MFTCHNDQFSVEGFIFFSNCIIVGWLLVLACTMLKWFDHFGWWNNSWCHLWAIFGAYCFCSGGFWSYIKCLCATRIFNVLDRQNSIMYGVMFLGFFSGFDFSIRVVS